VILAPVNSMAAAFGQAATQAPQPMQAADVERLVGLLLLDRHRVRLGAEPVFAEMKPPAR
jgi:hypothetical protein